MAAKRAERAKRIDCDVKSIFDRIMSVYVRVIVNDKRVIWRLDQPIADWINSVLH